MTTAHEDCFAKEFLSGATDLRNGVLVQFLRAGNKMRNIVIIHQSTTTKNETIEVKCGNHTW